MPWVGSPKQIAHMKRLNKRRQNDPMLKAHISRVMQKAATQRWSEPESRRVWLAAVLKHLKDHRDSVRQGASNWLKDHWQNDPEFRRRSLERLSKARKEFNKLAKQGILAKVYVNWSRGISKFLKRRWKNDEEFRNFMGKVFAKNHSPSEPQKILCKRLREAGMLGLRLEYRVGVYRIDIANPKKKIAIETDGTFFHENARAKKRDKYRDRFLKSLGWKVIRLRIDNKRQAQTHPLNLLLKVLKKKKVNL